VTSPILTTSSKVLPTKVTSIGWSSSIFFSPFLFGMALAIVPVMLVLELLLDREVGLMGLYYFYFFFK